MPATLIEKRQAEIQSIYTAAVGTPDCCERFDLKLSLLEKELSDLYKEVLAESRKASYDANGLYHLWKNMAGACNGFINYVQALAQSSGCPANFDTLLDLKNDSEEKAEFYRC